MEINPQSGIVYCWEALGVFWLVGLGFSKPTIRAQEVGPRLFHIALAGLGFTFLGTRYFRLGWLGERFLSTAPVWAEAGFALTLVGCLFAVWARITLGRNWSGRATVKAEHELITQGPYSLARHPIYTGLLTAALGTGLAGGEWRCVTGFVLIVLALMVKMSQEEKLMEQTFPEAYPAYRHRVKALLPGVF